MTVDMERYTQLLHDFTETAEPLVDCKALEKLKEKYKTDISSNRTLESITDIKKLLAVLEKRGMLDHNNITTLEFIGPCMLKDEALAKLISDYNQWLRDNPCPTNYLYNSGKSKNSFKVSETASYCDILCESIPIHEAEEQCAESLLHREVCRNINQLQVISSRNVFSINTVKKNCSMSHRKRMYIIIGAIAAPLIIILFSSVYWFFVKVSHIESTATLPTTPVYAGQFEAKMPYYTSNFNVQASTQSRFSVSQTQYYATTSATPPVNQQQELQNLSKYKILTIRFCTCRSNT